MGLLIILIGYFFDFKNDKKNFFKDIRTGAIFFIVNILFFTFIHQFLNIGLLYCIFSFGAEIIIVFSLKAYIESRKD